MDAVDFAAMLKARLPEGPAWALSDVTDGDTAFDWLIAALAEEPARLEEAILSLLEKLIPDNSQADLVSWERIVGAPTVNLTDEERLARIRGILTFVGDMSRAGLELVVREASGNVDAAVFNRCWPNFEVGISGAGDSIGDSSHTWLAEMYDNILEFGPDEAWDDNDATVTANDQWSPVTLDTTATEVVFGSSGEIFAELDAPDNADVVFSVWLRSASGTASVEVQIVGRDGTPVTNIATFACAEGWNKFSCTFDVGAGASAPSILMVATSETVHMSYALAHVRNAELETELAPKFPLHTFGVFATEDEFATLKSHDNEDVSF